MGFNYEDNNEFDESSYVKVNERLAEFWEKYPQGRINTFVSELKDGILVKAVILRDINDGQEFGLTGMAPATGHAFLPGGLKGDKVLEYTETVAIGRALAILGHKVEKSIATAEEMKRFNNMKSSATEATVEEEGDEVPPPSSPLPKLKSANRFKLPGKKE